MYEVTIEGIAKLTEEVIKVEFRSEIVSNSTVAAKVVATIVITGQISFDSDRLFMKESTKSIAAWSLLRPGHGDVYKNVKVVLTNTEEIRYELPYAFVVSYHERFEDQNGFFKLVVKEVNSERYSSPPSIEKLIETPSEKDIPISINEESAGGTGNAWGTTDDLMSSATAPGKGGVTPAGRAFQKHAGNPNRAGTFTGEVSGNAANNTAQGAKYLDDILNNPNSTFTTRNTKAFGDVLDVRLPDGTGARWSVDGKTFIGFLEKFTSAGG